MEPFTAMRTWKFGKIIVTYIQKSEEAIGTPLRASPVYKRMRCEIEV
jgi:hypothetical protein